MITVAVCTHQRAKLLADCVDSLLAQDLSPDRFEILVVDDGSTDDTALVVAEKENRLRECAPTLRYVRQSHSGLNAARNLAIAEARGDVVHFIDDDELAPVDLLSKVDALLEAHPDIAGVGGPYRDREDARLRTCARCSLAAHTVGQDLPMFDAPRLLGGNMALRKSAVEGIGDFDVTLNWKASARGDEVEWFDRAAGRFRFAFDPQLWVWHRRDYFDLRLLLRHSFMQGKFLPAFHSSRGRRYRPSILRIVRCIGHAISRRCAQGLALAARETGAFYSSSLSGRR